MPSKSKSQQRLMGAAYAAKKNKTTIKELSPELQKILKSMNKKQLKEFAKTKHSKLPEHTKSAATNDLFKAFAKVAMHKLSSCSEKNCGTSAKMNNKNDDKGVKEKKVQEAGKKVKIVESLGGTKPVKTTKKSTALNLKQYKTKKTAAGNISFVEALNYGNPSPLTPIYARYGKFLDDKNAKFLKDQELKKALKGNTLFDFIIDPVAEGKLDAQADARAFSSLPNKRKANRAAYARAYDRALRKELGHSTMLEKTEDWLKDHKDVLTQGGISALAGLGSYGVSKALGGNEWVNAGAGITTGALTYALQDKRVRNAIAELLAQVSNKVKA